MAVRLRRVCGCGHRKDAHEHYRRGTDCAGCDCTGYRPGLVLTVALRTALPATAVVVPDEVPATVGPYVRPVHGGGPHDPVRSALTRHVVQPRAGGQRLPAGPDREDAHDQHRG
jgi:hypothetical protein